MKKRPYHYIDEDIRYLVACMNACAFRTYASCQGHGYPVDSVLPYIAFTSRTEQASLLSRRLREDAESARPELNWGWEITGSFDSAYSLCFRLSPTRPHKRLHCWLRSALRRDFNVVAGFVKRQGGPAMKKNLMAAAIVLVLTHCTSFPPGGNNRPGWYEELCAEKKKALDDFDANPDQAHLDRVIELDAQHAEGCRSGE